MAPKTQINKPYSTTLAGTLKSNPKPYLEVHVTCRLYEYGSYTWDLHAHFYEPMNRQVNPSDSLSPAAFDDAPRLAPEPRPQSSERSREVLLGGSWVVISRVLSPLIWVISIVILLITLLISK